MKEKSSNNFFYLTSLYVRRFFNLKNIILFLVFFILLWSFYYDIASVIANVQEGDETRTYIYQLRLKISVLGIYFTFITTYSYIHLKKNNFDQVNSNKNSLSNIAITFFLFFLFWGICFIVIFLRFPDIKETTSGIYWYKITWFLYLIMLSYNLISIFLVSLISEKLKDVKKRSSFLYIFLIMIVIVQFIIFLYIEKILTNSSTSLNFLKKISFAFFILIIFLILLNFMERLIKRKNIN